MIKQAALIALDAVDTVLGRRNELTPPRRLMFDGPRDPVVFRRNGEEFLSLYRDLCALQPHHRVLDVGSGIGRKTVPLLRYLDERGSYFGFDVAAEGIEWCQQHITAKHPGFRFQRVDVFNARYNPTGRDKPGGFRFPCEDESFDFVSVQSVFTHMLTDDSAGYVAEIRRVLAPDGCCLSSFFLLNEEMNLFFLRGRRPASALIVSKLFFVFKRRISAFLSRSILSNSVMLRPSVKIARSVLIFSPRGRSPARPWPSGCLP